MIDWGTVVIGPLMDVFGESFTYVPQGGVSQSIVGVYDEAYIEVNPADGTAATTEQPVLGVRLTDFQTTPKQGDTTTCQRTGQAFVVREVRLDGHGHAMLMLQYA